MKTKLSILLLLISSVFFAQNPTPFNKIKVTGATKKNDANRIVVQDSITKEYHFVLKNNFIPITGTTEGNPFAGNLEIKGTDFNISKIYQTGTNGFENRIEFNNDAPLYRIGSFDDINGKYAIIDFTEGNLGLQTDNTSILIRTDETIGVGLRGEIDYSSNITDLDYTQKKYVDRPAIRTVSSATNLTPADKTLNISSGTFTTTIDTAFGYSGITYEVVNSGSGIITLDPFSTETINGQPTLVVPSQSGYTIKSDNSNWIITDRFKQENLNRTQWSQNIATTTVATGNSLNIFTLIPNSSKVANGTDGGINELNIVSNGILIPWHGTSMTHEIRVIYTIATGTDQNYNMELRWVSDNSVIGTAQIDRNSDTGIATAVFSTYTGSASDPFVTGGFYIAFRNDSGASADLTTNLNLFITSYFR